MPEPADDSLSGQLCSIGLANGLDAVGVTSAEPFVATRRELERRRDAGLHGGMQFTYRNPTRSTDPSATLPGAASLVVAARSYRRELPARAASRPVARVARYAWEDHYAVLRRGLEAVADRLRDVGWRARVLADDNALVDRAAAHRAGLGWYGKNANLLLPGRGSWFVLGSVVTDAELAPTPSPVADGCGPCRRCIDGCPTGAIVAPGVVDARRCLAWLVQATGSFPREHRVALGDRIYGCDDCQEVCPPNRSLDRREGSSTAVLETTEGATAAVDLIELLDADDDELLARHGRWYIPERDPRYLRRNALVVLGNIADGRDEAVVARLLRYLRHPDPLLRSHAAWAARRVGRHDLLDLLADDHDPMVRAELASAPPPVQVQR